jgi:predicted transcriptional regulator
MMKKILKEVVNAIKVMLALNDVQNEAISSLIKTTEEMEEELQKQKARINRLEKELSKAGEDMTMLKNKAWIKELIEEHKSHG